MEAREAGASGSIAINAAEVHQALSCLYDGAALGQVALASRLPALQRLASVAERALKLRALLLDCIEQLQSGRPASFRSAATRSYDVLTLRFVEGLTMARIADELFISERQAYRDLVNAEERLAEMLNTSCWTADRPQPVETRAGADTIDEELRNLIPQSSSIDVNDVLGSSLRTVQPLAKALKTSLICSAPPSTLSAIADPVLLRTTLVKMLSTAVRNTRDCKVHVDVKPAPGQVTITLRFAANRELDLQAVHGDQASMAQAQGLIWNLQRSPDLVVSASITLVCQRRRLVLVLEDNNSTIELYRRFLMHSQDWELAVCDPHNILEVASDRQPAVIVLDVLMPEQDGWQVMQALRAQPETAQIPIIVCSVFDEMDLAQALGASGYIKKPVSRDQFLASLEAAHSRGHNPA